MPTTVKDKKLLDDRELLDARKGWAGEIAALTEAAEKALPGLQAAVDAAADRVEMAKIALKEAVDEHRTACYGRANASNLFGRQRDPLEARLRSSAPPAIDELLRELGAEMTRLQLSGVPGSVAARQARLNGLRDARRVAEELRLQVLSRGELTERLDVIRNALVDEVAA